jgi:hypothetical protein
MERKRHGDEYNVFCLFLSPGGTVQRWKHCSRRIEPDKDRETEGERKSESQAGMTKKRRGQRNGHGDKGGETSVESERRRETRRKTRGRYGKTAIKTEKGREIDAERGRDRCRKITAEAQTERKRKDRERDGGRDGGKEMRPVEIHDLNDPKFSVIKGTILCTESGNRGNREINYYP